MNRNTILGLLLFYAIPHSAVTLAQTSDMKGMDMKGMSMESPAAPTTYSATGVVKSVDAAAGVITLAHEPIKSLNWPAMTMGFKVKDKALLDKAKPGAKVKFTLVQVGTNYVITTIE